VYEDTSGYARDVYVSGNYAFVADNSSGVAVIDVSNPSNPGTPHYALTSDAAFDIKVSGNYLFVAVHNAGFEYIRMINPLNFGLTTNEDTTGSARGVFVHGDYVYLACYDSKFAAIQVRQRIDKDDPIITSAQGDFTIESDYSGQSISWTATDTNPDTYRIFDQMGGTYVVTDTPWTSGVPVVYNLPEGLDVDTYYYTIIFQDDYGNDVTDNLMFTIEDTTVPNIINTPNHLYLEAGYSGASFSWNITDASPDTYTIELMGTGIVEGPSSWESGVITSYNIPDGFGVGQYQYRANFTDQGGHLFSDLVNLSIVDTTNPLIIYNSGDIVLTVGYSDEILTWTFSDATPATYTIELMETGLIIGPYSWTSDTPINYYIPEGLSAGTYSFNITVTDDGGNSASYVISVTIRSESGGAISFGNYFLLIITLMIIGLSIIKKKKLTITS
jgi:hypothetical protein